VEVVASLSQGRTAAAQCGLFTYKSIPVIFEPPCRKNWGWRKGDSGLLQYSILTCFCSHYEKLRRILVRIVGVPKNYYLSQIALSPENRIGDNFELLNCVTSKSRHFLQRSEVCYGYWAVFWKSYQWTYLCRVPVP